MVLAVGGAAALLSGRPPPGWVFGVLLALALATGAAWSALLVIGEEGARWVRHPALRLALFVGPGLLGPLATAVVASALARVRLRGPRDVVTALGQALWDLPGWISHNQASLGSWMVLFLAAHLVLGGARLGWFAAAPRRDLRRHAALTTVALCGGGAALPQLETGRPFMHLVWAAIVLLLPWALVLGLAAAARLDAWIAARWERRWSA